MKKAVKLAIIFLAIMLTACPVYADNAKMGKKQKTKWQIGCTSTAEEEQ